jgi:hypothetical protein
LAIPTSSTIGAPLLFRAFTVLGPISYNATFLEALRAPAAVREPPRVRVAFVLT